MTRKSFDLGLAELHDDLLYMGSIVEEQVRESVNSLLNRNMELAQEVIDNDHNVDNLQKKIDNQCIRLIGLEQPLASDLRNLFTTTKVATDLERVGDHAAHIARTTIRLKDEIELSNLAHIAQIIQIVTRMVKQSVQAFVEKDEEAAYEVSKMDDEIDLLYRSIFTELIITMVKNQEYVHQASQLLFVCKDLERIADHATNICEWTIYLVSGEMLELND